MDFKTLFPNKKPIIACVHLLPLPGAPLYDGDLTAIYDQALLEAETFQKKGIHGLIIENFNDKPFFPDRVPNETVATLAGIARTIVKSTNLPIGINVLRNDAQAALAIATAVGASFIRVNVHGGAVVSEQGIVQSAAHHTLRLRQNLKSNVLIFADVSVKHAAPLADRGLAVDTKDLTDRGLVDAIIVSGELTGSETNPKDLDIARNNTHLPIIIGSGVTPENLHKVIHADGFIVGSYFKKEGKAQVIDPKRIDNLLSSYNEILS